MKKRLLITSIVMMLVVAVALSTATYAWFTSNAKVEASSITFTAAANDADAIAIGWTGGPYGTSDLVATTNGANMAPMIPNEIVVDQTTIDAGDHQITFLTAQIETSGSDTVFKSVGGTNALKWETTNNGATPTSAAADSFYIKNISPANVVGNIKVTATITPNYIACEQGELVVAGYTYYSDNEGTPITPAPSVGSVIENDTTYKATVDLVRIAIFTRDLTTTGTSDSESAYILRGVLANAASDTYFGTNTENTGTVRNGLSQSTFHDTAANKSSAIAANVGCFLCKDGGNYQTLAANGVLEIKVIVWLDGEALNDNTQKAGANVSLRFDASAAQSND